MCISVANLTAGVALPFGLNTCIQIEEQSPFDIWARGIIARVQGPDGGANNKMGSFARAHNLP